jgi:N-acetylglucosaminyl-diphospho-decaprenol L-rhamnosyltransferase
VRKPSLEFSIVSGANEDLIVECLRSIYSSLQSAAYVWKVTATCNHPETALARRLKAEFPRIDIVQNSAPRGFASNHNVVLRRSTADYVWILNDDLIFRGDTVRAVTEFMELPANARVAVVSPRLDNTDGSLQPSTYSFSSMPQTLLAHSGIREHRVTESIVAALAPILRPRVGTSRYWKHDRTTYVETFRGACVSVRMEAVREVGPMAEVALVGGEEIEWHYRFRRAGWKIVFFAETSVVHHGGQTVEHATQQHLPEYLKGTLYYFRSSRPRITYRIFCGMLLGLFGVRFGASRIRGDKHGVNVALRYLRVAWDALRV